MQVTEITVSSGRVIPHPHQGYANLRPMVTLRASLDDHESLDIAHMALVEKCEAMLDNHVSLMHEQIEDEYNAAQQRREEEYERRARERSASVAGVDDLDEDEDEDEEE